MRRTMAIALVLGVVLFGSTALAETTPKIGLRGGIGTDINLGIAYGGGVNYLVQLPNNSVELGIVIFGGSFDETTDEGKHSYDETTDVFVFGLLANYLFGYQPRQSSTFFVAGVGLAVLSVDWEETSSTDETLGPLLPGGGSKQSADGSTAGTVFNLGIGRSFTNGLDIRIETPIILSFSAPGESAGVIPTAIATVGFRF